MKCRFRRSSQTFRAMQLRAKHFLIGGAAVVAAIALPAIAQDRPESILPPGFGDPAPAPEPVTNNAEPAPSTPSPRPAFEGSLVEIVDSLTGAEALETPEPVPQVEYPAASRRDPRFAGTLDP